VLEVIDLAKSTKVGHPRVFICVGGHSASFTAIAARWQKFWAR
jgi:hypothetical protein